jgi:hypothetical protein
MQEEHDQSMVFEYCTTTGLKFLLGSVMLKDLTSSCTVFDSLWRSATCAMALGITSRRFSGSPHKRRSGRHPTMSP